MTSLRHTAPILLLFLPGCVSGPDHTPPELPLPAKFDEGRAKSNGNVTTIPWWTSYGDRRLDDLVSKGLAQNLDVLQALERVNSSAADVTVAGAGALPSLDINASHTVSGETGSMRTTTQTTNTSTASASLGWALDVFGYYRRSKEKALASLDAAYASADDTRLTLVKNLVSSYIDLRYYQQRLALSKANLKSRRETYELTQTQLRAGAAAHLDVVQADGLVQSALAEIPSLETNLRKSAHRVATLLGMPASSLLVNLQQPSSQPVYHGDIRAGVPADLIRNRPDIRKAERDLAAAVADIGVTEAQLYPSISLSGSISPSWVNPSSGKGGSLNSWSFGPSVSIPIFDGGTLRANVDISKSEAKTQYLTWKAAVFDAIEEVENAMTAVRRDTKTVEARRREVRAAEEALDLSTKSYKDGASSLLDVLDSQRSVSDAQANLASAIQQVAKDYVDLNVATGAGYQQTHATSREELK